MSSGPPLGLPLRKLTGVLTKETTMTGYQYTVARVLDAQVEKVWRVWTQAEH
jgi:hypothetical protein